MTFLFFLMLRRPPIPTLFPYTTLFRSFATSTSTTVSQTVGAASTTTAVTTHTPNPSVTGQDRKSTRLNSSHSQISYAVFCLKKKKNEHGHHRAVADRGFCEQASEHW